MLTSSYNRRLLQTVIAKPSLLRLRNFSTNVPGTIQVTIEEARDTTARALRKIGWDESSANLQAEIMTAAEVCGNNQGLVKMYQPIHMAPAPGASKPEFERNTQSSCVLNGNQSPGMVVAALAADRAVDKVLGLDQSTITEGDKTPVPPTISIVPTYNTNTSSGQLGYYVERMARRGVIGIALANSPEFVAAAPGGKRAFGTNPLAVGIPQAGSSPFVFDMATSAVALFGVLSSKAKGEPLPPNVAYGKDGKWTTDASEVMDGGAIATFGGHKGAGLSLCVELLAGALSGGAVLGQCKSKVEAKNWGHTMIAIRPDLLVDDFESRSASIIQTVKDSGVGIRIPGENSARIARERTEAGILPIPEKIWESILNTAEHGLQDSE